MNIIDKKMQLTLQMREIIESQASVNFSIKRFHSLNDIHDKLDVKIIIEDKCLNKCHIPLEDALEQKKKELDILYENKKGDEVSLVAAKKKIEEHIKRLRRIINNTDVLGEYKDGNIYLYIESITSYSDWEKYLKTTYIHEMFHAYFDRDTLRKYIPYYYQIEEPLAEAGTLLYLHKTKDVDLSWAVQNVQGKKPSLPEYAFGADLYEMWINSSFDLDTIVRNYKFDVSDDLVDKAEDIVKTIHSIPPSRITACDFERWLIVYRGYALSTANNYAFVIPESESLKYATYDVSNRRTYDFYKLTCNEINNLTRYCNCFKDPERIIRLVSLYLDYKQ